jgi:hypothetical protein
VEPSVGGERGLMGERRGTPLVPVELIVWGCVGLDEEVAFVQLGGTSTNTCTSSGLQQPLYQLCNHNQL